MTIIALDYDDTYTLAPDLWNGLINIMHDYGWTVHIVTYRHSTSFKDMDLKIPHITDYIFTNGKGKHQYCLDMGISIDVWIDDSPDAIIFDFKDLPIR